MTTAEISKVRVTVTAEDDTTSNTYTNVATDEELAIANSIAALKAIETVDATNVTKAQAAVDTAKALDSDDAVLAAEIARVEGLIAKHNEAVSADFAAALEAVKAAIKEKKPDRAQALLNIAALKAVTGEQKDQIAKLQKAINDLKAELAAEAAEEAYQQFKTAVANAVDAKGSKDEGRLTAALNGLNALDELEALKLTDAEQEYLAQLKAEIAAEIAELTAPDPTYTVTVDNNVANITADLYNEDGEVVDGTNVAAGTKLTLKVAVDEGYNDTKFYVTVNGEAVELDAGAYEFTVNSDTKITIQGEDAEITEYTIWFKVDTDIAEKPTDTDWNVTKKGAIPDPVTDDGYTFNGWFLDEDYTQKIERYEDLKESDFSNGVVTLYADITANDITVTFNYYNENGALIVGNTQTVTFKTNEQPVKVVLGTDAAYDYALNGVVYAARAEYPIDNLTEDTTFVVTVHAADTAVVAENSTALQAALEDPNVDTVYLQDGSYELGGKISSDVTIIGNGKTTLDSKNYYGVTCGIFMDSDADLVIEGVTFEDGVNGIMFCGDSLTVKNCTFKDTTGAAIYLCEDSDIKGAYIEGCTFEGCVANIAVASNSLAADAKVIISNCKAEGDLFNVGDPSMESQITVK